MTTDPIIQVTDLTKTYGETIAVDGISLDVSGDQIFGLLGPNGAGKTTFIEILQCLRRPTSGTATVLGYDAETDSNAIKDRIGVVPQSFHTFERLTVRENIALMRDLYDQPRSVGVVLEELDLDRYADTPFADLSGGYQRRTGIAMALVSDPEILFLDEPTTGLDPAVRRATWDHIETLPERGTAVVLTSHYMDEVEALADRVALLMDGQLIAQGGVPELIDEYGGDVKVVVDLSRATDAEERELKDVLANAADGVHKDDGTTLVGRFDNRQRAQGAFGDLQEVAPHLPIELASASMEDVFLELAGRTLSPSGDLR